MDKKQIQFLTRFRSQPEQDEIPTESPAVEVKTPTSFVIASSPHVRAPADVRQTMLTVILSLLPATFASFLFFGMRAVILLAASVVTCVVAESFVNYVKKEKLTATDGSAVLTGLLFALTLPPDLAVSSAIIGAAFSILVGKHAFGGLGYNLFNPALLGRAFLQASFPVAMTTWSEPGIIDGVTAATPLAKLKFDRMVTPLFDLFSGNTAGSIGETSAIALLIGGAFLLLKKMADWRIPLLLLASVAVFTLVFNGIDGRTIDPSAQLMSGGLLLGAFFMATDMVTSPVTPKGVVAYSIGIGFLVVFIRRYGGLPEGVMYAILMMNGAVPLIDRLFRPRYYGEVKR